MTCKDCIHFEACGFTSITGKTMEKDCKQFKNKADFVEVVRCKDCKKNGTEYCIYDPTVAKDDDDFCSCGKRRDN